MLVLRLAGMRSVGLMVWEGGWTPSAGRRRGLDGRGMPLVQTPMLAARANSA